MSPQTILAGVAVTVGFALGSGVSWKVTSDHYVAKQAAVDRKKHKADLAAAAQRAIEYKNAVDKAQEFEQKFLEAQGKQTVVYRDIRKKVPYVVTQYIERPGADLKDLPAAMYTVGFVRLWNDALDGTVSGSAADSSGITAKAGAAGEAADFLPSGTTVGDLLGNHIDNAERCNGITTQLIDLIDYVKSTNAREQ